MASLSIIDIEISEFKTVKQKKLLAKLKDKRVLKGANTILKDYINEFVPKQSGALRRSAKVTNETISWGNGLNEPYAIYQYNGEIFGKNYPIIKGGRIVGWYSKPGVLKYPTGRMMGAYRGESSEFMGWPFGYTEPGTGHHWDQRFKKDLQWKARANREVTRYIKKECKKAGISG